MHARLLTLLSSKSKLFFNIRLFNSVQVYCGEFSKKKACHWISYIDRCLQPILELISSFINTLDLYLTFPNRYSQSSYHVSRLDRTPESEQPSHGTDFHVLTTFISNTSGKLTMEYLRTSVIITFLISMATQCLAGMPLSQTVCFAQKSLTVTCHYGEMLRITRTLYGYNSAGLCQYQPGDCIKEEHRLYPCVGRESCSINLPSGGVGGVISSCNKPSNYFHVEYECIPVADRINICESPIITAQQGYIVTPGYPNNYASNVNCTTQIQVKSYQHLQLYILDLDLEMVNSTCSDYMLAQDTMQTLTLCGKRWNEPSPVSWKNLTIRLSTNGHKNHKGFWLHFRATPALTTTTSRPTTPQATRPKSQQPVVTAGTTDSGKNIIPITKTVNNVNVDKNQKLPFAAIVGGVIGTLSFVLVVLLLLLIVKWSRERKRRRDKTQFIEVQNPGYRNSNEFQQNTIPRTDVCYNYVDC